MSAHRTVRTPDREELVLSLVAAGKSRQEIADEVGCGRSLVDKILRERGVRSLGTKAIRCAPCACTNRVKSYLGGRLCRACYDKRRKA